MNSNPHRGQVVSKIAEATRVQFSRRSLWSNIINAVRTPFITACLTTQSIFLVAQQKYPVLTRNITFEELLKRKISRKIEWTDPNGIHETMIITEMPIPVDRKMKELTRDFVRSNYGRDSIALRARVIVFHAMGDGDLKNSLEVSSFLNDQIPKTWGDLPKAGLLPNGAHFIIDKNGDVFCLTPPMSLDGTQISYDRTDHQWLIKRHQDGNPVGIGIENVTDQGNYVNLTSPQLEANARLARWLIWMENGKIKYLTSHHQYAIESNYARFLTAFNLKGLQKNFRTRNRKDIGDKNLLEIIKEVNGDGYSVQSFFDLE